MEKITHANCDDHSPSADQHESRYACAANAHHDEIGNSTDTYCHQDQLTNCAAAYFYTQFTAHADRRFRQLAHGLQRRI